VLQRKYAGFDVERLNKLLRYAKAHMEDGQLLYMNLLESYRMVTEPIANMITQLMQRNGSRINNVTGPRKVQQYYRLDGGLGLGVSAAEAGPNWTKIVQSICPDAKEHDVRRFTDIMHLDDFCVSFAEMSDEARQERQAQLKKQLTDELAQTKQMAVFCKTTHKAEKALKTAKKKLSVCEVELEEAREVPDRKGDIPDLRGELVDARNTVKERQSEFDDANAELQTEMKEQFEGVMDMLKRVAQGVGEVYQNVLLVNGVTECAWSLKQMHMLFGSAVKSYCANSVNVYTSFLEDTAIVDSETSMQLCLAGHSTSYVDQLTIRQGYVLPQ